MATAVLGIVGNLIYPGIGGAIGAGIGAGIDAVVGSLVARSILGEAAAPPPDQRRVPTADEGTPAPWLYGQFNRVTGQLIYLSEIERVPINGSQKGKSPQTTVWNYKCDVGIAWARRQCNLERPIKRIWASGELIFDEEVEFSIAMGGVSCDPLTQWAPFPGIADPDPQGNFWCQPAQNPNQRRVSELQIVRFATVKGTTEDDQWSSVQNQMSGVDVTLTGFANGTNDGTFRVTSFRFFQPTDVSLSGWEMTLFRCSYTYPVNPAIPSDVCVPNNVPACTDAEQEIAANVTFEFEIEGFSLYFDDIRHYPGANDQARNALIRDDPRNGPDVTPAFRGTCYTVIRGLDITKWASTLPQFEAEVDAVQAPGNLRDMFDNVLARNESTRAYQIDTSELSTLEPIFGLQVVGPTPPSTTLKSLMTTYDIEAQERLVQVGDDLNPVPVLFFVPREAIPVKTIDYSETSARQADEEGRVHALVKRSTTDSLPQEFTVDYVEVGRDLQPGTLSYSITTGTVRNTQKFQIPTVQTQPGADKICRELLWKAINFHDGIEFNLSSRFYGITEGDRLSLDAPSDDLPIQARVQEINIGENGVLEINCQIDNDLAHQQYEYGGYSDPFDTTVDVPDLGTIIVMDMAPLSASDANRFGIYVANQVASITGSITYNVYVSNDLVNWTQPQVIQSEAVAGVTESVLEEPQESHAWDFVNTVDIRLESDQVLESLSMEEVESGLNWALIGREVVGFMTATPKGPDEPFRYTLSGLLRGRNDSQQYMDGHIVSEVFVLLPPSSPAVTFIDLEPSVYRQTIYVVSVPSGFAPEQGVPTIAVPAAETLRPYSLHGFWGVRTPGGDNCVYATPRTRVPFRLLSGLLPPVIETGPVTDFVADVYWLNNSAEFEFVRTVEACQDVNGQIAFSYSAQNYVEDLVNTGKDTSVDPLAFLRFVIRHISDTIGNGREAEFCMFLVGVEFEGSCEFTP